jgi:hypothetical protein
MWIGCISLVGFELSTVHTPPTIITKNNLIIFIYIQEDNYEVYN